MEHPHRPPSPNGFTLLEMAVVVSVIGLLIGGVLVGKNMYRTAKLQETTVKMQQLLQAAQTFNTTYNAPPGDLSTATSYWGSAGGTGASSDVNCSSVNSLTLADIRRTCNGNGNGVTAESAAELARSAQQLVNASLLTGRFTGTGGYAVNVNTPEGPLPNSMFTIAAIGMVPGNTTFFQGYYGITAHLSAGNSTTTSILTPVELNSIDSKIDDGNPAAGMVLAGNHPTCTNSNSFPSPNVYQTPALYQLEYLKTNNIGCYMYLRSSNN